MPLTATSCTIGVVASAVRTILEALAEQLDRRAINDLADHFGVSRCRKTSDLLERIYAEIGEDLSALVSPRGPLYLDTWNDVASSLGFAKRKSFDRLLADIQQAYAGSAQAEEALNDEASETMPGQTDEDADADLDAPDDPVERADSEETDEGRDADDADVESDDAEDDDPQMPEDGRLRTISAVRRYLRRDLARELEGHRRIAKAENLNEATYCAILYEVVQARLHDGYGVHVDTTIPGTALRPDLVIFRNQATGVIAIEVKPNAQIKGLLDDLKKLEGYVRRHQVNFGLLVYFSSTPHGEQKLRAAVKKSKNYRKLAVRRVQIQKSRSDWRD